jgi:beta-N-acetylhexosaminidase
MALAAVDDSDVAYQFGRATAIEARSCGIQWVFSPVADISAHPDSPIVNTRSFGSFPDTVKKMAAAMTAGLQENGVCATAKHFPGDGFDYRDQHLITSRNPLEQEEYMAVFGSVYKELIEKGIGSIMVGHIALPSFESKNGGTLIPASISPDIVQGLLREKLGFEGVIISDALDMRGLRSARVKGSYAVEVFKAGVDMLLFADLREDFDALKAAYEKGEISEETTTEFRALGRTISERAVTEVRGNRVILPITIKRGGKMLSIQLRSDQAVHADHFENLLEQRGASLMRVSESDAYKLDAIKNPKSYQQIFLIYIFTPNWANNYIRPTGNYLRHLQHFLNRAGNTVIAVSFGSPYHMFDLGEFPVFINAYSNDKPTQEAVLRYLTGELSAQGKSPVSLEEPNLNNYLSGLTHYREYISGNKG